MAHELINMRFLLVFSVVINLSGCGQPEFERVPVAGTVYVDGKPLDGGTIRFVPEVGRPSSSNIHDDGSFNIASRNVGHLTEVGLKPGRYRVQVASSEIVDDETIRWKAPQHYADFRTSGLEVLVNESTEKLKIELESVTEDELNSPSDPQPEEAEKS